MEKDWSNPIVFYLNGKLKKLASTTDPRTTLLCYIRDTIGLTGTKLGCGEGGCGACTVMISYYDAKNKRVRHKSANACLTPLCSVDGLAITTVEGIGGMKNGLHPVQQRISSLHGSQCGFCTPGIVMALYAFLREYPNATPKEIEEAMDGNLCRCTGYRPIIDAAKSLSNNKGDGCCGGSGGCPCKEKTTSNSGCCGRGKGEGCCKGETPSSDSCCGGGDKNTGCCKNKTAMNDNKNGYTNNTSCAIACLPSMSEMMLAEGVTEPIFPPALLKYSPKQVKVSYTIVGADDESGDSEGKSSEVVGSNNGQTISWYQPTSLSALHELKQTHKNNARIIVGNTEVGIETRFKYFEYSTLINPQHIEELNVLKEDIVTVNGRKCMGTRVGGNITINHLREYIEQLHRNVVGKESIDESVTDIASIGSLVAIKNMLTWFASNQIRNVACVAGNIVTASPISDLNPMLLCCQAVVRVSAREDGKDAVIRDIPMHEFFLAYRKVNLQPEEVLESVFIPYNNTPVNDAYEFVVPFKQARRREDDISIVSSGMRFVLQPVNVAGSSGEIRGFWVIKECTLSFGGMSPISKSATHTALALVNKPWCSDTFDMVYDVLKGELSLPEEVPGGQAEYRMALCASFLFRAFVKISLEIQQMCTDAVDSNLPSPPQIDMRDRSAADSFVTSEKLGTYGEQTYVISDAKGDIQQASPNVHAPVEDKYSERKPVGDRLMHKSAPLQVTGEALYTDDISAPANTLHAALVTSTKAHAKITSIDTSVAETCSGFVGFYSHNDIPKDGSNELGAIIKDEEVFVTNEVKFVGNIIGIVVAESHEEALYAARKVVVTYEDLPCIISIEEAIAAESFYPTVHTIECGDVNGELAKGKEPDSDIVVVEGETRIGSQEHFYLETNCTLVVPKDSGCQLEVYSSTQNPNKTQMTIAHVCGLPANNVVCRVKRMGGGFGGKETKSVFIAATAAIAAHLCNRPVKIVVERELDMAISGQRHAYYLKYKAGCSRSTGKLSFMDAELYNNAGFSWDLSQPVMDRSLFHADNAYHFPNMRVKGIACRTNQPSHTAYRGFGGPQGMFLADTVMSHLADEIKMPVREFMKTNLYKNGDCTHYGEGIEGYHVPEMYDRMMEIGEVKNREAEVKEFNDNNRWKKRGISLNMTKFGINFTAKFYNQGGALVLVYTDGSVLVSHGGTEMGQGLHTKMIQVCAQAFGISDDMVHVEESATNCVANASPTAASMSTDLNGMAVLDACEQIRKRLEPVRARLPKDASWTTVVSAAYFDRVNLAANGFYAVPNDRCGYDWDAVIPPPPPSGSPAGTLSDGTPCATNSNTQRGRPFNYYTQGVVLTEVEIDCLTGDSRILRSDILMDIGKSINPAIDIGQIEGAFIQGFGYCTMEEMIWGDGQHKWVRPGQLFTRGPGTYKIPAFNDVPLDMRVHLTDTDNKFAVHSSKAVGEPPFYMGVSAYFAIRQAIKAARLENKNVTEEESEYFELNAPVTSERIRTACQDSLMLRCTGGKKDFQAKGSW